MRPPEIPRHRWGDNTKADLIRNMMQGMDWIHLSQNMDKCWVLRFHKMQEISGLVKEL
jgi:hypothetical protein